MITTCPNIEDVKTKHLRVKPKSWYMLLWGRMMPWAYFHHYLVNLQGDKSKLVIASKSGYASRLVFTWLHLTYTFPIYAFQLKYTTTTMVVSKTSLVCWVRTSYRGIIVCYRCCILSQWLSYSQHRQWICLHFDKHFVFIFLVFGNGNSL